MKLACIAPSTLPSETANSVQVMKVSQALTQLGHKVCLFVPSGQPTPFDKLRSHYGVKTEFEIRWLKTNPSLRKIDFAWQSVHLAKKEHFELIYTRMLWVALLALHQKLPVILEMHELPGGRFSPRLYRYYLSMPGKKLTVFITRGLQEQIETTLNIRHPAAQSCIAPDGVDLERFVDLPSASEARRMLGLNETFSAVYSGGFYPGRGLENLYELAKHFPQVQFVWIGGKPAQLQKWQQKLSEESIQNVVLAGYIANQQLPLYQAAGDVLLMPYKSKVAGNSGGNIAGVTSPMKLFEYLASGRAILSSDLPVLHEVLNETNALFYPPEDTSKMLSQFQKLFSDNSLRNSLSAQAKKDALKYSWKQRMQNILDIFIQN
jgi:glycosyltransferase involved in cell wall biosynthesis